MKTIIMMFMLITFSEANIDADMATAQNLILNKKYKEALEIYNTLLVKYPTVNTDFFWRKGMCEKQLGLYNDAIKSFEKMLQFPEPSEGHTMTHLRAKIFILECRLAEIEKLRLSIKTEFSNKTKAQKSTKEYKKLKIRGRVMGVVEN
jgi:tetratricopeptide (TPR) repeat protein